MTVTRPVSTPRDGAEALRGLCGGAVYLPGDQGYDAARTPWNLTMTELPAAVAYPAFPDEVRELVRTAAAEGLRIAPQGTGHGSPALAGQLGDAVLLRTSAMTELRVDADRRTARVGAGALWGDVVRRAGVVGLAGLHTSSPSVGVIGSTMSGGLSFYGRRYGLQSSMLTAVEVVLADGSSVRATDDHEPELLWAARGGGGGFGVVTAAEFELVPVASAYAGMLAWDWARADEVMRVWAAWATEAPEDVTTIARLLQAPDDRELPDGIRARQVVLIDGAVLGDERRAQELLAPLRALRPEIDTFATVPAASLARLHIEPEQPTPAYADSIVLQSFPEDAIDALLAAAGPGSGSRLLFTEVRQLGGALGRPSARPAAMERVDGAFLVLGVGVTDARAEEAELRSDADRVLGDLAAWQADELYLAMVEHNDEVRRGWTPPAWERLRAVRAAADPHGLFVARQDAAD